jgi:hypothetical protein
MSTSDEYLQYAEECMAWARKAETDAERKTFLDMARAWTTAAAKANAGVIPVNGPAPDDPGTVTPQLAPPSLDDQLG